MTFNQSLVQLHAKIVFDQNYFAAERGLAIDVIKCGDDRGASERFLCRVIKHAQTGVGLRHKAVIALGEIGTRESIPIIEAYKKANPHSEAIADKNIQAILKRTSHVRTLGEMAA